jgi:hypothetical protein
LTSSGALKGGDSFCKTATSRRENVLCGIYVAVVDRTAYSPTPARRAQLEAGFGTPLHEVPLDDVIHGGRREYSQQRQAELADDGINQHDCGTGEHHDEADPQRQLHP